LRVKDGINGAGQGASPPQKPVSSPAKCLPGQNVRQMRRRHHPLLDTRYSKIAGIATLDRPEEAALDCPQSPSV